MTDESPETPAEGATGRAGESGREVAESVADRLIARVADHDESLAEDVRRIIERGAQLHDERGELERDLEERDRRIAELERELAERDDEDGDTTAGDGADGVESDRVERLERDIEERDQRIADLESRLDERESELADVRERLKRKQADFQNYKRRAERKREQIRERATEDLVERLLDVRDNLRRAVENDHPDVESLLDGVEMTLREFDRVLEEENVAEIAPDPGEEVDPERHEVMMRVDSDRPEGAIADVYAPGYRMAEKVVRPAQVTVSEGNGEADGDRPDETSH
jgi:molecular chaperone GrpE